MSNLNSDTHQRGSTSSLKIALVASLAAILLSGCGGGGGGSSSVSDQGPIIALSWQPNPAEVDGYSVYYGSTEGTVNNHFSDYSALTGEIDPADPSVEISAYYDLGLRDGEQVCISIQAYNSYGTSGTSAPVCTTIS